MFSPHQFILQAAHVFLFRPKTRKQARNRLQSTNTATVVLAGLSFLSQTVASMLPMRSSAARPCSLAAMLLRRLSSNSSSSIYSVRRHASSAALSSRPSASYPTTCPPCPLSINRRTRGFTAWASAPGPAGAESPATKVLEAKVPALPPGFDCYFQFFLLQAPQIAG